ncbi:MAG: flagellar basal body rod protein FlgC [Clostridiales bacterium]|jgi:flagellar basal-body rod protein FlgC|nr:flagellar basal body rod protein FlgC [Clostridiales bacterium]
MSFFGSLNISASALTAQRLRMDLISENIANVDTTRAANGGPYQRRTPLFEEVQGSFDDYLNEAFFAGTAIEADVLGSDGRMGLGVRVASIATDGTPGMRKYEPAHPDADADGYVVMPNVNIVTEMVNMISASRSYEANVTALGGTKTMIAKTMEIGR